MIAGKKLIAALVLTGVAAAAEEDPRQVSAVPIPDGQIAMAVAEVDALVEDAMARTSVPGIAVAVVSSGDVVLAKGYGVREIGEPEPVDADTVFQLASVSKAVGATVVAHQVSEGTVAWDTPVTDHLDWFALSDPRATEMLTIGDLYSHRSGLPDHAGDLLEDLGYGRREVLERLRYVPLDGFRDHYAYTNFGLTAAAEAVAAATDSDWETLSDTAVYRPLGMDSTSSRFADFIRRENRAVPHMREGSGWASLEQREPDAQTPAGGVSSSARDMAKWMLMVLAEGGDVAKPDALLAATSPHSVSSPPPTPGTRTGFYGYGFNVGVSPSGRVTFSHSGAFNLGAATSFYIIPSADVGILVLSNAQPVGVVEAIGLSFADLAQFGQVTRDWLGLIQPVMEAMLAPVGELANRTPPANPAPARELASYAGDYSNNYFGLARVDVEGDGLVLRVGPEDMTFALEHWSDDVFAFVPRGENAPVGSRAEVAFQMGPSVAEAMTVDIWNEFGLGTFTR